MCNAPMIMRYHRSLMSTVGETICRSFDQLPGPLRIPFLGPINEAIHLGNPKTLHHTITKHHIKYGPIFRIQIANVNAIFIKDPEMMRNVFAYEGKYPRHPLPEAWTYFNKKHQCKRGLFFMDDEEWYRHRKLLNQFLMVDSRWMAPLVQRICSKTIDSFADKNAGTIEVHNIETKLYKWSIEVILCLMLGRSYNEENVAKLHHLVESFANTVYHIFHYSSKLMAIPPYLADRLQLDAWQKFEEVVPATLALANNIIDISLNDIERGDGLLSKLQDCGMSNESIKRIFADFIIAAGDTTAFSTLWCLYLLAKNPATQDQIRENVNNGCVESPLIRGTVREALRMFPVAPFVGRFLDRDATLGNYRIPKNTLALLSLYSAGRDAGNFHSPDVFLPQRWLRGAGKNLYDVPFNANASLPFAIGSRSCIGRKVALLQMQHFLAMMVQKYRLSISNQESIESELKMVTVPNRKIKFVLNSIE